MRHAALPLVLALLVTACVGEQADAPTTAGPDVTVDADELVQYTFPELRFSIAHPREWTVDADVENGIVSFTAPDAEGGYTDNFNVAVGDVPEEIPPAAYYQGELGRLQSVLSDVQVIEQADVPVGEATGRGITVVADQNGLQVGVSRLIVLQEGTAWEVTYVTPASRLEQEAPLISEIFKSFGFET